jgi:myo-inositol 2-dehydrogenase/D-chiro-inositol 1-dehydrogenase
MRAPRVGIVGTNWGLMHLGAFRAAGAEIVALCGAHEEKTRAVAAREGVPLATTRFETLVEAVDLVVVASPDRMHAAHVRGALGAGRHVLCEKPLTLDAIDARRLVDYAHSVPVRAAAVSFPYRELPTLRALRAWLIGRPRCSHLGVTVRNGFTRLQPPADGWVGDSGDFGGVSHVLDAALWLAGGRARTVQATLVGHPVATAHLQLELNTGATVGVSHLATQEPGIRGQWTLTGEGWDAAFEAGYRPALGGWKLGEVVVWDAATGKTLVVHPAAVPREGEPEPWAMAHREIARAFLAAVSGEPAPGLASLEHGAHLQEIFAAAIESQDAGTRVALSEPRVAS